MPVTYYCELIGHRVRASRRSYIIYNNYIVRIHCRNVSQLSCEKSERTTRSSDHGEEMGIIIVSYD